MPSPDFHRDLVDARFPLVSADDQASVPYACPSFLVVDTIPPDWTARRVVRNDDMFLDLCRILPPLLVGVPALDANPELNAFFQGDHAGMSNALNASHRQTMTLIAVGIHRNMRACVHHVLDRGGVVHHAGYPVAGTSEFVDWAITIGECTRLLWIALDPSVMTAVERDLPTGTFVMDWTNNGETARQLFIKVAAYLGHMEQSWCFVSDYNRWMVFRLVLRSDGTSDLHFSNVLHLKDSTVPFRAYLAVVFSEIIGQSIPVPNQHLAQDPPEHEVVREITSTAGDQDNRELFLTAAPSGTLHPRWTRMRAIGDSVHVFAIGDHLQLVRSLGFGSTGWAWEATVGGRMVAVKIAEINSPEDDRKRARLLREVDIYAALMDECRTVPRFFGAFEGAGLVGFVMELLGDPVSSWDELKYEERVQVFQLFSFLHRSGIWHGDVRPHNVLHARDTEGFRVIDFTESRWHQCSSFRQRKQGHACRELIILEHELGLNTPHASNGLRTS